MALQSLSANYTDSDEDLSLIEQPKHQNTHKSISSDEENEIKLEKSPRQSVANVLVSTNKIANLFSYGEERPPLNTSEPHVDTEDIVDKYLPPEPTGDCDPELQKKFQDIYERCVNENYDINRMIQDKKEFRNPSIYEKLIEYCDINEFGTNFPSDVYDPTKWSPSSFYDELAKAQKVAMDKFEKEPKAKKSKSSITSAP